jgi:hypothetical protein
LNTLLNAYFVGNPYLIALNIVTKIKITGRDDNVENSTKIFTVPQKFYRILIWALETK